MSRSLTRDAEAILKVLEDGHPHGVTEIELRIGKRINTGRIRELRKEGWLIKSVKESRSITGYQLQGKTDNEVIIHETRRPRVANSTIQGYLYRSVDGDPYNDHVCQVLERGTAAGDLLENGPSFRVRFGDGSVATVSASELTPWFPT